MAGRDVQFLSPTGMQVSVRYDSAQNASMLDILFTTGSTSIREMVMLNGVYLDADAFALGTKDVSAPGGLSFTYVPEPTAATLTLPALAGLVNRRRR